MIVKGPAKINLTLDVLNRREDGYHNVKMVMQSLELCDEVTVELSGDEITVSSNSGVIPCDDSNIAYKAAKVMLQKTGIDDSCSRTLHFRCLQGRCKDCS